MTDGSPRPQAPTFATARTIFTGVLLTLLLLLTMPPAHALQTLDDGELGEIWGQSLVEIQKRVGDGLENGDVGLSFTRIRLGVKAEVNANIDLVEMGNYDIPHHAFDQVYTTYYSTNKSSLAQDIKIRNVSLGCLQATTNSWGESSCGTGPETFKIERPYIEIAYKNDGAATEELVGMRMGFELANGWLGGIIDSLSGHVYGCSGALCGESKAARSNAITALGLNWNLGMLGRMQAVNTKNFFFGLQKIPINYPRAVGSTAASQITAQPGFWVNLRDGLTIPGGDIADVLIGRRLDNCWRSATYC